MAAHHKKSRRAFLKATSVTAGAAAFGTLAAADATAAETWDATADVVVLGYGGAGACAAIEAHDAGAKVILLEKQAEATLVSNTRMSGGMMHCPARDADRAALKAYAKAMMSGDNVPGKLEGEDPELVDELAEVWASDTPGTIDFMKSLDPDFNPARSGGPAFPNFPGARASGYRVYFASYTGKTHDSPTRNLPKNQKINGEAFFTTLAVGVSKRKIPVLFETPASELIFDGQRRIVGVLAMRGGKPFRVRARRGVVLATGGYEYSVRMRRSFLEGPGVRGWAFWGTPANTGDGIAMGMAAGGRLDKIAKCAAGLICAGQSPVPGLMMGVGRLAIGSPHSFNVDNHGNRFADETLQSGDPSRYFFYKEAVTMDVRTLDYPRIPSWIIFDETFRTSYSLATQSMGPASQGLIDWTADNASAIKNGWIIKADTIEGLIPQIQAHPDNRKLLAGDNLIKAAARFNEMCAKGKDEDFGRGATSLGAVEKPPFYASPLYAGGPNTKGGLSANGKRQVLDWNSKPVPRLYAAGEIASAFKFVYQGGGNLTECIVFGRIAGRNAAAEKPV